MRGIAKDKGQQNTEAHGLVTDYNTTGAMCGGVLAMSDDEFYQLAAGLIDHQDAGAGLPVKSTLDIRRTLRGARPRLKELEAERKNLLKEMEQAPADYSFRARGGSGPRASCVEAEVERRGRVAKKLQEVEQETNTIRRVLECLQVLPAEDRNILERLYLKREGHLRVSLDVGVNDRHLNGLAKKALWAVGLAFLAGWKSGQK